MATLSRAALLAILLLMGGHCHAQIINCNGFIKGNYLEAGMNWNGAFGSSTPTPLGYHQERTSTLYNSTTCGGALTTDSALGFVADVDKDGWYSGTPTRFGDYLLPGAVQEGWSYMADGEQVNAWNSDAAIRDTIIGGLLTYFMSYTDTLGVKTLKYQSVKNGVYITQIFTLKLNDLYIEDEVIIENTNLFSITNIAFMRLFAAHPDQALGGPADAKYKIERTLPDTLNRTIVSGRGTVNTRAYMALATQDPRAKGFIYRISATPAEMLDLISIGGEAGYLYGQGDSIVANASAGIVFDIGNLPSASGTTFKLLYAFSPAVFDSTLNTVDTETAIPNMVRSQMRIFPNPTSSHFRITHLQHTDQVSLYDLTGRNLNEYLKQDKSTSTFDISAIPTGMYYLLVRDQNGWVKQRIPLQKQ